MFMLNDAPFLNRLSSMFTPHRKYTAGKQFCPIAALLIGMVLSSNASAQENAAQTASTATELVNTESGIVNMNAYRIAEDIRAGKLSSETLVLAYLDRITKLDRQGPKIQALITVNPDALTIASQRDEQVKNGDILGPLHGVPVIVKDNVETARMATTAGSLALLENKTGRDAPIIKRLKDAGAIILAKANLSEWANFRDSDSVSGWSGVGGQTRNPHSLDRTPCGSSSGTGAAIAAHYAPLGIGTETNGSIICPSAMNGIVGVKPTVGLLSRSRIVPISVTQDTAGPMTRSVKDAALMLSVMAGSDEADAATDLADKKKQDYLAALDAPLKGKRIGVFRAVQSEHEEIIAALDQAKAKLEAQGVEFVDIQEYEAPEGFWDEALNVLLIEFKHELNAYLADAAPQVSARSLAQLIEFNKNSERELAIFDQSLFIDAQATEGYNDDYHNSLAFLRKSTRDEGIDKLLEEYEIDAIMMPSQTPAFLIDPVYGDSFPGGFAGAGWMAAIAGYPQVSVPMGSMRGLPINVSFMGAQWSEAALLNIAYQYEQSSKQIVTPEMVSGSIEHSRFKSAMTPYQP